MTTCLLATGALPLNVILTLKVHRISRWLYPKRGRKYIMILDRHFVQIVQNVSRISYSLKFNLGIEY